MVSNHRYLIVIIFLSIALVGISVSIRVQDQMSSQEHSLDFGKFSPGSQIPLVPELDPSFLEDSLKNNLVNQPAPNAPKKTSSVGIPGVTAVAYLVSNVKTGKIYFAKNITRIMPVASMSKLITAFVATDVLPASSTIMITQATASTSPDGSNLQVGERFDLSEILEPLLLSSSNVAAESIASTSNRSDFMELMRSYAWEVGMPHSFFADPSGISPRNVASAEDLFGLAKYLINFRPDILLITRIASTTLATTTEHGSHQIVSTHPFVSDSRFIGGKTGRTKEAGETMLTILNIDDQPIVFVILGAKYGSRESDTRILLGELLKK